jgi:hypothetical protein
VASGCQERHVVELAALVHTAEEQAAPAHVTAPRELRGKDQPLAEHFQEGLHVFRASDASEEDDFRVGLSVQGGDQGSRIAHQGSTVAGIRGIDAHSTVAA